MRRALVTTLAVPVLLLAACGSDDEPSVEEPAAESSSEATEEPTEDTAEVTETVEETTEEPTEDTSAATEEPAGGGKPEGGKEGKAAAGRTEEFFVAMANADPAICELLLDFDGSTPMKDSKENLKVCAQILVPELEGLISEDEAAIIDLIEINGADVDGDTATVDKDNFSELFAQGFGDASIGLKKVDDEWYVDANSLQQ